MFPTRFEGARRTIALVLLLVIGAVGCRRQEQPVVAAPFVPAMRPAPQTPIATKREELGGPQWDPEWDKIVELALPAEMLSTAVPRDVARFCPQFYAMSEVDKRTFWAYFFQALAGAEAGLKPTTRVQHTDPEVAVPDEVTKRIVKQEGLLQLAYADQKRYGCDFDWEADKRLQARDPSRTILRPKNNLECGVKILERQIIEQHKRLLSGSG